MKTIRWAILGAGKIARSFVKDFPLMQQAVLVAVASGDAERGAAFAAENNIPLALSHEALYTSNEVDAVYVATTHNFHFEQVLQCLRHGKHVLCEKPITIHPQQFEILAATALEKRVFLMEAMWTYFLPALQTAKKWLSEGRIGQLKFIQSDFGFAMEKNLEGRMYNPALAGGALLDLGIYPIAMAHYFTRRAPERILSSGSLTMTGVDETLGMLLQYDGVTASLCTSIVTQMTNFTRLYGETGFIEIPDFWKARELRLYNNQAALTDSYDDGRKSHGFIFEMQHANDCISAGELQSAVMPHSRSRDLQNTMLAVRKQVGWSYPGE